MSTFLFRHSYIRLKGLFEVLKVRLKPLSDGSESGLGVMIWGGSGQWGRKVMDYSTLLSHIRFETRMKLLCSFLHFCRVHEYTNQEPSSRKSFPRRFLKKIEKLKIFSFILHILFFRLVWPMFWQHNGNLDRNTFHLIGRIVWFF